MFVDYSKFQCRRWHLSLSRVYLVEIAFRSLQALDVVLDYLCLQFRCNCNCALCPLPLCVTSKVSKPLFLFTSFVLFEADFIHVSRIGLI